MSERESLLHASFSIYGPGDVGVGHQDAMLLVIFSRLPDLLGILILWYVHRSGFRDDVFQKTIEKFSSIFDGQLRVRSKLSGPPDVVSDYRILMTTRSLCSRRRRWD
jgi:hypothetical protein